MKNKVEFFTENSLILNNKKHLKHSLLFLKTQSLLKEK